MLDKVYEFTSANRSLHARILKMWNPPIFKTVNPGLCAGKTRVFRVWRKYLITIKIIKFLMRVFLLNPLWQSRCVYEWQVYACCHKKRDGSFRVQRCAWPHSSARILLFTVNPADIGRSGACFFCCRDTL